MNEMYKLCKMHVPDFKFDRGVRSVRGFRARALLCLSMFSLFSYIFYVTKVYSMPLGNRLGGIQKGTTRYIPMYFVSVNSSASLLCSKNPVVRIPYPAFAIRKLRPKAWHSARGTLVSVRTSDKC